MNRKDFFKASLALALSGVTLSAVGSNYFGEGEAPKLSPEDARLTPEEVERIGKEMIRNQWMYSADHANQPFTYVYSNGNWVSMGHYVGPDWFPMCSVYGKDKIFRAYYYASREQFLEDAKGKTYIRFSFEESRNEPKSS